MLNNILLMGRLTAAPELKQTPSAIAVTSFSIAVERDIAAKDGTKTVDFINIVAWRQAAEFVCKYFDKGRMIVVNGSLQSRSYEDKQGQKRTVFEVIADKVYFGDSKPNGTASTAPNVAAPNVSTPTASIPSTASKSVAQSAQSFSMGDFEEIDDDSDLPF